VGPAGYALLDLQGMSAGAAVVCVAHWLLELQRHLVAGTLLPATFGITGLTNHRAPQASSNQSQGTKGEAARVLQLSSTVEEARGNMRVRN